jgi:hypothetical protein
MLSALALALSLTTTAAPAELITAADTPPSTFACGDKQIHVWFGALKGNFVAVVDAGDGPHTLKSMPWDAVQAQLRWSDGPRTLTWSSGVNLMWMDGDTHLMCNGAHHHQH